MSWADYCVELIVFVVHSFRVCCLLCCISTIAVLIVSFLDRFTKYRDIRDALHQFEGIVSACLVLAYEELSLVMHLDEV